MNIKRFLTGTAMVVVMLVAMITPTFADTVSVDFETPTYTVNNINLQDGWSKTGPYDAAVVANTYGYTSFEGQSLRISDAVTSGSFGDQTFAKPLNDSVGETAATNGTFSPGTKQTHFEMQFDIASTQATEQSGMHMSVSPDRGDGSRMSYHRFDDSSSGINVFFDDVQQTVPCTPSGCANFVETPIGTISRTPHIIKLTMDTLDGSSNDVVKVWIDGVLVHTGTSWEDYYRYDPEASAEQSPRIVKTVEFRESATANLADSGKGFLIDNLSLASGPSTVKVTVDKFIEGTMATSITANSSDFPMSATWNATNIGAGTGSYVLGTVGHNTANAYEAVTSDMSVGADYSTNEVTGGAVVGTTCTTGQPYVLDGYSTGDTLSAAQAATKSLTIPSFTNLLTNKHVIVWNKVCEATPTPTPIPNLPVACTGMTFTNIINGTSRSQSLQGTNGNDLIFGGGGSDYINGNGGNDCIVVGNGSSVVLGAAGNDVIIGGNASDSLNGGAGNDKIYGNGGSDSLVGGADNDEIWGGNGSDYLSGDAGVDTLNGEGGSDAAIGGTGSDTCVAEAKVSCEL